MFSRLMCYSFSNWLTRQTDSDPAYSPFLREQATAGNIDLDSAPTFYPFSGAFPLTVDGAHGAEGFDAPKGSVLTYSWSTPTPVDSAGWTEVVIQEEPFAHSNVKKGRKAEVNASINIDKFSSPPRGNQLLKSGGNPSDTSTCGCPGRFGLSNSSFSCLSFNEVTK